MVNEFRPSSTIAVENVNGSQTVSVVVWIQAEAGQGDSKVE